MPSDIAVSSSISVLNLTAKKPPPPPKHPFPDTHLSYLLSKIEALSTGSLPALVDSVYQDLKVHKVKKNAIEVKVKEVAQKDGRKVWTVKPEFAVSSFLSFVFQALIQLYGYGIASLRPQVVAVGRSSVEDFP